MWAAFGGFPNRPRWFARLRVNLLCRILCRFFGGGHGAGDMLIGDLPVELAGDGLGVAEPRIDHVRREHIGQLGCPRAPHVLPELRPGSQAGLGEVAEQLSPMVATVHRSFGLPVFRLAGRITISTPKGSARRSRLSKLKATLDDGILDGFAGLSSDHFEQTNGDHGRIETRKLWVCWEVELPGELAKEGTGLRSLIVMEHTRQVNGSERRFIGS